MLGYAVVYLRVPTSGYTALCILVIFLTNKCYVISDIFTTINEISSELGIKLCNHIMIICLTSFIQT